MKYKQLIPLLPKYAKNYMGRKTGDILESAVIIVCNDPTLKGWLSPNDPALLERTVKSFVPIAQNRHYSSRGTLIVELR